MSSQDFLQSISSYTTIELPEILGKHRIPSASVVVVKDGEIIYTGFSGYRDLEKKIPTDTKTLYAIGSTSKAFTAVLLGQLVDEGKLQWNDLVTEHIPEFHMLDPFAGMQMNIRDIMCHRCGLPSHDMVWFLSKFNRQELLTKIRYMEPFAPFRTEFCYNNLMWMVAGIVVERITGKSWEENLSERIFKPLGMDQANYSTDITVANNDKFALPYELMDGKLERVPFHQIDPVGPAGSINAHITDYAKWLLMNVNRGKFDNKPIISESSIEQILAPQMSIDTHNPLVGCLGEFGEFSNLAYTLGWVTQHYRGHRLLQHSGGIDGFSAFLCFLPEQKTGVGVLTNRGTMQFHYAVAWDLLDRAMGWEPCLWVERMAKWEEKCQQEQEINHQKSKPLQMNGTKPSHLLGDYVGEYSHPAYGNLVIDVVDDTLVGKYNHVSVSFTHFHYDVFTMNMKLQYPKIDVPVRFETGFDGKILKAMIPWEPSVAEIEFAKR